MSLLDKFAAVEVKNDERISDGDRRFCEIHQEAYSASLQVFKDLRVLWGSVVEAQQEIFFGLPSEKRHSDTYLGAIKNLSVSEINEALEKRTANSSEKSCIISTLLILFPSRAQKSQSACSPRSRKNGAGAGMRNRIENITARCRLLN
jgi:hypothetical protein